MLLELSYVCMPTFIATIANMDQLFQIIWTDCLRLFVVIYKLILLTSVVSNVLHVFTGFLCP